jgi:transcriptional regulator with XRE-family HTH domain
MARDPVATGLKIAKRRQALGLRQEDLAAKLGVSPSTVANWERGKSFPARKLGAVEQVLGVDLTSNGQHVVYLDPDEAFLWSLTRYSPAERHAMITALRSERAAPTGQVPAVPAAHNTLPGESSALQLRAVTV